MSDSNMNVLIKAATVMRRHHTLSDAPPDLLEALKAFDALPEYYKAFSLEEVFNSKGAAPKAGLT